MPALSHRQLMTAPARAESPIGRVTYYCAGDGVRCARSVDSPDGRCWNHPPCSVCSAVRQGRLPAIPHTLQGRPCPYDL